MQSWTMCCRSASAVHTFVTGHCLRAEAVCAPGTTNFEILGIFAAARPAGVTLAIARAFRVRVLYEVIGTVAVSQTLAIAET